MLRVYDDFVSSPDSYYQNILAGQSEKDELDAGENYN